MFTEYRHAPYCGGDYILNPVLDGDYPDPTVLFDGKEYWMTHSTFAFYPGLSLYRSADGIGWEYITSPLRQNVGTVWAPELCCHNGRYYLYFPALQNGTATVYAMTAEKMAGPWSAPVDLHIPYIDPGHVVDENGRRWLFLNGGYGVPLRSDGLATDGAIRPLWSSSPLPEAWNAEGPYPEAPKLCHVGGYYHLFYADGGTSGSPTSHGMFHLRSRSLFGPWEPSPFNPILHTDRETDRWWSVGHGTVYEAADGLRILYHGYENGFRNMGRKLLTRRCQWTEDGWLRPMPSWGDLPQRVSHGLLAPPPLPSVHAFFHLSGDCGWKQYGLWDASRRTVTENGLLLRGTGNAPGDSMPWVFPCGEKYLDMAADFSPADGCECGFLWFSDPAHFCGIGFSGTEVRIYRSGTLLASFPHSGATLRLHLVRMRNHVRFLWGETEDRLSPVPYTADLETEPGDIFRPGIYAAKGGRCLVSKEMILPLHP